MYIILEQIEGSRTMAVAHLLSSYSKYLGFLRDRNISITMIEKRGDLRVNERMWVTLGKQEDNWRIYLQPHIEVKDRDTGMIFLTKDTEIDYSKYELLYRYTGKGIGLILTGRGPGWKKLANNHRAIAVLKNTPAFLRQFNIKKNELLKKEELRIDKFSHVRVVGIIPKPENIAKILTSHSRLGKIMREVRGVSDDRWYYSFE